MRLNERVEELGGDGGSLVRKVSTESIGKGKGFETSFSLKRGNTIKYLYP